MDKSIYSPGIQNHIRTVEEQIHRDPERTLEACNEIMEYGLKEKDSALLGFGYYYTGEVYFNLNEGELFFDNISKALAYLISEQEWELMARSYNLMGIKAISGANIPIALDYYSSGISICEQHGIRHYSFVIQVNIGALYMECERYEEALNYMEASLEYLEGLQRDKQYYGYLTAVLGNMIRCLTEEEDFDRAEELCERIRTECWEQCEEADRVIASFVNALYLHKCERWSERDEVIEWVDRHYTEKFPVLNAIEDFYPYCRLLITCNRKDEFWNLMDRVEPMTKSLDMPRISQRILSLKMEFYRKTGQQDLFLDCAGEFYELTKLVDRERHLINNNVIALRRNLDMSNRVRRKVEIQNQILREKSQTDALTKLGNRFQLNDYSEGVFLRACQSHAAIAVEILDIDYFKEFNDNYGHQRGDEALVEIAKQLDHMRRHYGAYCARYGGDEFIIIYEDVTKEQVLGYAAKLRERVMKLGLEHRFSLALPYVTISQGICWGYPDPTSRMWDYLHTADDMLYRVKKTSRNNYSLCEVSSPEDMIIGE